MTTLKTRERLPALASPVVRPHFDRAGGVALLALFGAAGQQDRQHLAVAAEIHPVSRSEMDPVFEHPLPYLFDVR